MARWERGRERELAGTGTGTGARREDERKTGTRTEVGTERREVAGTGTRTGARARTESEMEKGTIMEREWRSSRVLVSTTSAKKQRRRPGGCPTMWYRGENKAPGDEISSPQEGLRILRRCYEEHIIIRVVVRKDTWEPKYNPRRRRYSSGD